MVKQSNMSHELDDQTGCDSQPETLGINVIIRLDPPQTVTEASGTKSGFHCTITVATRILLLNKIQSRLCAVVSVKKQ